MSSPQRIQRKRTKGWKMPAGAVYVGRPTKWGNPFRVGTPDRDNCMVCLDRAEAVAKYRSELTTFANTVNFTGCTLAEIRSELRGKDLACFCPLDQPCHSDVLLELANTLEGGAKP
jgi:hypothetical protein